MEHLEHSILNPLAYLAILFDPPENRHVAPPHGKPDRHSPQRPSTLLLEQKPLMHNSASHGVQCISPYKAV